MKYIRLQYYTWGAWSSTSACWTQVARQHSIFWGQRCKILCVGRRKSQACQKVRWGGEWWVVWVGWLTQVWAYYKRMGGVLIGLSGNVHGTCSRGGWVWEKVLWNDPDVPLTTFLELWQKNLTTSFFSKKWSSSRWSKVIRKGLRTLMMASASAYASCLNVQQAQRQKNIIRLNFKTIYELEPLYVFLV